jgi:hypothetical protein
MGKKEPSTRSYVPYREELILYHGQPAERIKVPKEKDEKMSGYASWESIDVLQAEIDRLEDRIERLERELEELKIPEPPSQISRQGPYVPRRLK